MAAAVIHHYRLGDSTRAKDLYRGVLARVPSHYGAHYQLAVTLLALGETAEAEALWATFRPRAEAIGDRATLDAAPEAWRVASR